MLLLLPWKRAGTDKEEKEEIMGTVVVVLVLAVIVVAAGLALGNLANKDGNEEDEF